MANIAQDEASAIFVIRLSVSFTQKNSSALSVLLFLYLLATYLSVDKIHFLNFKAVNTLSKQWFLWV